MAKFRSILETVGNKPSLALAMTLAVLPYAKSLFLAAIWATRAPRSERE